MQRYVTHVSIYSVTHASMDIHNPSMQTLPVTVTEFSSDPNAHCAGHPFKRYI